METRTASVDSGPPGWLRSLLGAGVFENQSFASYATLIEYFRSNCFSGHLAERVNHLAAHLKANEANRPKTLKSLESRIQALIGKTLTPKELEQTIQRSLVEKIIKVSEKGEVTYSAAGEAASTRKADPVTTKEPRT